MLKIGMRIPGKMREMGMEGLAAWAAENGVDAVDLPQVDKAATEALGAKGVSVGSVDLQDIGLSLSKDEKERGRGVDSLKSQIGEMSSLGLKTAFCCLIPKEKETPRKESFDIFKETYPDIVAHAESSGVSLAMEPYPGPAPFYPTLGCTPEMYRAIFQAIPSAALGICYDPSHYLRMGIDYLRVLSEFGDRVRHVHGKDTEVLTEGRYLHGYYGPTFPGSIGWSGGDWRYTIPGSGEVNWAKVMAHLRILEYRGVVSIELEDHVYGHTLEGSKEGILASVRHLRSVM